MTRLLTVIIRHVHVHGMRGLGGEGGWVWCYAGAVELTVRMGLMVAGRSLCFKVWLKCRTSSRGNLLGPGPSHNQSSVGMGPWAGSWSPMWAEWAFQLLGLLCQFGQKSLKGALAICQKLRGKSFFIFRRYIICLPLSSNKNQAYGKMQMEIFKSLVLHFWKILLEKRVETRKERIGKKCMTNFTKRF